MVEQNSNIRLEDTLKAKEIENWLEISFYRRIAFPLTKLLAKTSITPNQVTVASFFVGMAAAAMFFFEQWYIILIGIALFVIANLMDCIDGQLARMTGIKTKLGRILDGFAGDLWFITLYLAIIANFIFIHDAPYWFALIPLLSGLAHGRQANITDYYKTFHLFLISKKRGSELEHSTAIDAEWQALQFKKEPIYCFFLFFYRNYTRNQEALTPQLQKFINVSQTKFDGDMPDNIRTEFRAASLKLMPFIDLLTFNARTIVLFISALFGYPFIAIYLVNELILLEVIRLIIVHKHEKLCKTMAVKLENCSTID